MRLTADQSDLRNGGFGLANLITLFFNVFLSQLLLTLVAFSFCQQVPTPIKVYIETSYSSMKDIAGAVLT